MKKLLYILFLAGFLSSQLSCETHSTSTITAGVLKAGESDKELSCVETGGRNFFKNCRSETQKTNRNVSSILPAYFWDTKMITW